MFQDQNTNRVAKRGTVESGEGGFEPPKLPQLPVFETGAFGHSATSPGGDILGALAESRKVAKRPAAFAARDDPASPCGSSNRRSIRALGQTGPGLRRFARAEEFSVCSTGFERGEVAAAVLLCAVAQGESPPVLWRDDADLHAVQLVGKTVAWAVGDHGAALCSRWRAELGIATSAGRCFFALRDLLSWIRTTAGPRAARLFRTRDWKQDPFFLQRTQVRRGGGSMSVRCLACTPFDSSAAAKVLPPELPHPNTRAGSQRLCDGGATWSPFELRRRSELADLN